MKKYQLFIIISIILILAAALWLFRTNITNLFQPVKVNPQKMAISPTPPVEDLVIKQDGNVTRITPKGKRKGSFEIYRQRDSKYILLINYICRDEHFAKFYQLDLRHNRIDKLFELTGDIDQARIMNQGNGLLYLANYHLGDPPEGELSYMKKGASEKKRFNYPIYFNVSPDEKRVILGKCSQFYDFATDETTETGIDGDFMFGPGPLWHTHSRYVVLNDEALYDTETKTTKDFGLGDAYLTDFSWSPDGGKLAFRVQTKECEEYRAEFENSGILFSDSIAIYDIHDESVSTIQFPDSLAFSYVWADDGRKIVVSTVLLEIASEYINFLEDQSYGGSPEDKYNLDLTMIDVATKQQSPVFSGVPREGDEPIRIKWLDSLHNGLLIFEGCHQDNLLTLFAYNIQTQQTGEIYHTEGQYLFYSAYPYHDKVFVAGNECHYLIGKDLTIKEVFTPQSFDTNIFTFAACQKIVLTDGGRDSDGKIVILNL